MLAARNVAHRFGTVVALAGVSLDVPSGRAVALVGESGSGKTTLLRCFNRMVDPDEGTVTVNGADVRAGAPEQLRRGLGYVPQHGGLLPHWTVARNAAMVPGLLAMENPDAAGREALALVGLPPDRFADRFPSELSGGQRQRVALARALAARPRAVLLDEPFGALDAITRSEVQEAFNRVRHALAVTVLIVTHDLAEASRLADELVVLRAGRIEQRGTVAEFRAAPATEYVATLMARAVAGSVLLSA